MDLKIKNQVLLNKKINFFFDTKHIATSSLKEFKKNIFFFKEKTKPNYSRNKTRVIKLIPYSKKFINKKDLKYLKPIKELKIYIQKNKLKDYLKYFLIHGSLADNTYIKGWSDVDTFVVIKNSVLKSNKKISQLKKKIKYLYKFFFEICPLQHHGLIFFTEYDLLNYSNNYLPLKALKTNINLLDNKIKMKIKSCNDDNIFLFNDIKNRLKLLKNARLIGLYKHHPLKGKFLRFPLKKNRKEMFQLFSHLGYMNTLPAYYFSCIGRSVNKKDSFKLFNKKFKNLKIKKLMKKSEKVRFLWEEKRLYEENNLFIPAWVISILGKNYLNECIQIFESIIKEIEFYNEKKRLYCSDQKYF